MYKVVLFLLSILFLGQTTSVEAQQVRIDCRVFADNITLQVQQRDAGQTEPQAVSAIAEIPDGPIRQLIVATIKYIFAHPKESDDHISTKFFNSCSKANGIIGYTNL